MSGLGFNSDVSGTFGTFQVSGTDIVKIDSSGNIQKNTTPGSAATWEDYNKARVAKATINTATLAYATMTQMGLTTVSDAYGQISSNQFQPKLDGWYKLNASTSSSLSTAEGVLQTSIYKNGASIASHYDQGHTFASASWNVINSTVEVVEYLVTTDIIQVWAYVALAGSVGNTVGNAVDGFSAVFLGT